METHHTRCLKCLEQHLSRRLLNCLLNCLLNRDLTAEGYILTVEDLYEAIESGF